MDDLTPAELLLALDADDGKTQRVPMGGANMSAGEIEAYARAWRAMTPRQRLSRTRES